MFSQSTHTKIHLYTFSITRYDIHTRWCVHVIYDLFTSWMYKNKWCKFSTNGDRIYTRTHAGASSYYSLKDGTQRPRLSCPSPPPSPPMSFLINSYTFHRSPTLEFCPSKTRTPNKYRRYFFNWNRPTDLSLLTKKTYSLSERASRNDIHT